jgi:hypothetical protein
LGEKKTGEKEPLTGGPEATVPCSEVKFDSKFKFQTYSNHVQIPSNFDRSKKDLPALKKIEIKYGREGFEEGNNFLHRKFFTFEMYFELKFGEFKVYF